MLVSLSVTAWLLWMCRDPLEVQWLACQVAWTWDQVLCYLMIIWCIFTRSWYWRLTAVVFGNVDFYYSVSVRLHFVVCSEKNNHLKHFAMLIFYLYVHVMVKCEAAFGCLQLWQSYRRLCLTSIWFLHIIPDLCTLLLQTCWWWHCDWWLHEGVHFM